MHNLSALCFTGGVFSALFGYNPGTLTGIVLGLVFLALEGYAIDLRQRRIAKAKVALMQAQAEMNAEALVDALKRERQNEAQITAKLDEMRAKLDKWAREDAALEGGGVDV